MNPSSESKRIIGTALMIFFAGMALYNIGLGPVNGAGILYSAMVLYWTLTVLRRPVQPGIRKRIVVISGLMLLLLALRSTRYLFSGRLSAPVSRVLWYGYYLPFTMVPLLGLDASLLIWNGEDRRPQKGMHLLYALCLLLGLFIVTNDLHQLAFRFVEGGRQAEQAQRYDYGPVYYAAVLWIAGCVAAMLYHLMSENRAAGREQFPRMLLPVLAVPTIYFVTYYLGRLPLLRGRRFLQLPEAFCMFFICLMEVCLMAGWFPVHILRQKESEVRATASEYEKKNRLYEAMAASVMPQLASVAGILAGEAQRSEEEFREDMARACVLTAYIKRRCNLILKTAEQEELPPEELRLSAAESLEYLRLCGVTGAVFLEGGAGAFPGSILTAAYDLFEQAAEIAMQGAEALLVNIRSSAEELSLRLTLEQPRETIPDGLFAGAEVNSEEGTWFVHRVFRREDAALLTEKKSSGSSGAAAGTGSAAPAGAEAGSLIAEEFSALSGIITAYTIEKEELNARMRLHDDLGKMLLLARRYIQGKEDRETLLAIWRSSSRLLEENTEPDPAADAYAYMAVVARDVGIRLLVQGRLPEDPAAAEVVSAAIHECLTNTLRHAGGDELRVLSFADRVEFTNNGKQPEGPVKESGGLGMLRQMAEARGIRMQVDVDPVFRLTLFLK